MKKVSLLVTYSQLVTPLWQYCDVDFVQANPFQQVCTRFIVYILIPQAAFNPSQRDYQKRGTTAAHLSFFEASALHKKTKEIPCERQGWIKCSSTVATLRAEQGPYESSKGFVSKF